MVNRNLLRQFDVTDDELENIDDIFDQEITDWLHSEEQDFEANKIVTGRVLDIRGDDVVIDIGYKTEGVITLDEWQRRRRRHGRPPKLGDTIEVLLETVEDEDGAIALSLPQGEAAEGMGSDPRQAQGRRRRLRPGHSQDQGRPARQHRRQRLPARQPGRHPPAAGHRRLHRQDHRVQDPQDRRGAPQHRRQPPQADRGPPRRSRRRSCSRETRGRPDPQGHRQEHRRVRRVRRPRRHRRPAAHHRHELGPRHQPARRGQDRPGARGLHPQRRHGEGEDRPVPEAQDAEPVAERRGASTRSAAGTRAKSSTS